MSQEIEPESAANDNEVFVSLLAGNHSRIMGYILTLVPHRQDAEDIFQKVSLTLWKKFSEFDRHSEFFPWAAKIAFYNVCNHRRTQYRNRIVFSPELLELISNERMQHLQNQSERIDQLLECVEKLNPQDRQLLQETYSKGFSIKDLAEKTGKAVQTLYNRLTLLRRDLLNCMHKKTQANRV